MDPILGLILLVAAYEAAKKGLQHAGAKARSAAKTRWNARPKSAKSAPVRSSGRVGRSVGRALGAGVAGAAAGGWGFLSGAREGWPQGKQRAYDWHERRQRRAAAAAVADPEPVTARPAGQVPTVRPRIRNTGPRSRMTVLWPDGQETVETVPGASKDEAMANAREIYPDAHGFEWEGLADSSMAAPATKPSLGGKRWQVAYDWADTEQKRKSPHLFPDHDTFTDRREAENNVRDAQIAVGDGTLNGFALTELDDDGLGFRTLDPHEFLNGEDEGQPQGLASVTPIAREQGMAISTVATNAEPTTFDGLIGFLESVEKEAAADLEDATGDAERAKHDAAAFENAQATLASLDLDPQTLSDLSALSEDAGARAQAAQARQAAAESRAAHAKTAVAGVKARHQAMKEAHDATPHAAKNEFYKTA